MRHIPESMLSALLRILNEYEAGLTEHTLRHDIQRWHVKRIKQQLKKKY